MDSVASFWQGPASCLAGALLSNYLEIDRSRSRFASHELPRPKIDFRDIARYGSSWRLGGLPRFDPQTRASSSHPDRPPGAAGNIATDFSAARRATQGDHAFDGFPA